MTSGSCHGYVNDVMTSGMRGSAMLPFGRTFFSLKTHTQKELLKMRERVKLMWLSS